MAFLVAAMQYYQDPDKNKPATTGPSLEEVKTVVVKPQPKPAAAKPAAPAAPKAAAPADGKAAAIEQKNPAPQPAAVTEAKAAAEKAAVEAKAPQEKKEGEA